MRARRAPRCPGQGASSTIAQSEPGRAPAGRGPRRRPSHVSNSFETFLMTVNAGHNLAEAHGTPGSLCERGGPAFAPTARRGRWDSRKPRQKAAMAATARQAEKQRPATEVRGFLAIEPAERGMAQPASEKSRTRRELDPELGAWRLPSPGGMAVATSGRPIRRPLAQITAHDTACHTLARPRTGGPRHGHRLRLRPDAQSGKTKWLSTIASTTAGKSVIDRSLDHAWLSGKARQG